MSKAARTTFTSPGSTKGKMMPNPTFTESASSDQASSTSAVRKTIPPLYDVADEQPYASYEIPDVRGSRNTPSEPYYSAATSRTGQVYEAPLEVDYETIAPSRPSPGARQEAWEVPARRNTVFRTATMTSSSLEWNPDEYDTMSRTSTLQSRGGPRRPAPLGQGDVDDTQA